MVKIAVYTVITDGYDTLVPSVKQSIPCDFFCFTNTIELHHEQAKNSEIDIRIYEITEPLKKTDNRYLLPFSYRIFPFDIPELNEYDILIYMDGFVSLNTPSTLQELLENGPDEPIGISLIEHPVRKCLYQEIAFSQKMTKYNVLDFEEMKKTYLENGMPENWGLWTNNRIVWDRRHNVEQTKQFQNLYWEEVQKYGKVQNFSPQGQVNLSYVLWKSGQPFHSWPKSFFDKGFGRKAHAKIINNDGSLGHFPAKKTGKK